MRTPAKEEEINEYMNFTQKNLWLQAFASLAWYDAAIKFLFSFITKTSELLLAAGIVVSTANFLTDGTILHGHSQISFAWAWAQAIAIDSSLGTVFLNAFQSVRERETVKAVIFFTLTALLATVAGLITHFDALALAAGLPVSSVASIVPLWIMTALRSVAVIGFLLASRLKQVSFQQLRQGLTHEPPLEPGQNQQMRTDPSALEPLDYQQLARELAPFFQSAHRTIIEEGKTNIECPTPVLETSANQEPVLLSH